MPTLERALIDYDSDMLAVVASMWDFDLPGVSQKGDVDALAAAMSRPEAVDAIWQRLSAEERDALLDLQAQEGRLPYARFARNYGDIRPMGPARREREKPWLDPESVTEALYYKGLIVRTFLRDQTGGMQEFLTIPGELPDLLPKPAAHVTLPGYPVTPPRMVPQGHSTAVDDLATLLAALYIRQFDARRWLSLKPRPAIDRHLRRPDPTYRALLTRLAYDLQLITNAEGSPVTHVDREAVRPWLEASRDNQQRSLIEAWLNSVGWNTLATLPDLEIDGDWPNNPRLARLALLDALMDATADTWWSIEGVVAHLRETAPDFQRPGGDFHGWYLRDAFTGALLQGIEVWDRIEGAQLRAIISGPMHWLGVVQAYEGAFQLTEFGLALLERAAWPSRPDAESTVEITPQGVIHVPADQRRYDRLQVARLSAWDDAPPPPTLIVGLPREDDGVYTYRLTAQSLGRVREDGITAEQVEGFLTRVTDDTLPEAVTLLLEGWFTAPNVVEVQDMVLVSVKTPVALELLQRDKRLAELLRRQVRPRLFIVPANHVEELTERLRAVGVLPYFPTREADDTP